MKCKLNRRNNSFQCIQYCQQLLYMQTHTWMLTREHFQTASRYKSFNLLQQVQNTAHNLSYIWSMINIQIQFNSHPADSKNHPVPKLSCSCHQTETKMFRSSFPHSMPQLDGSCQEQSSSLLSNVSDTVFEHNWFEGLDNKNANNGL